ncbi:MAG TPA: hypothetical protein VMT53_05325 [Terriglobales bacterium]|nr:hypothetical protein [Terriglobales bacterium]
MTTPAVAIKDQIRELIHHQIEIFGQPSPLTSSELSECHHLAERIKLLAQELDGIGTTIILEERFRRRNSFAGGGD